jgi:hypothetical protein
MAVLAFFTGPITKAQYESVRKDVNWEGILAPGGIVHAASFDDQDHAHVADVWESVDALNTFVQTRLMPAMQRFGVPAPNVTVYPLHNLNITKAGDKYRI